MSADGTSGWNDGTGTPGAPLPDGSTPGGTPSAQPPESNEPATTAGATPASDGIIQAVAWIEQDGVGDLGLDFLGADFGRVMLKRFTVVTDRDGAGIGLIGEGSNVVHLTGGGADKFTPGSLASANDNVVWVGDEYGSGFGGVFGRDPQAVALVNGDTIVTWVGADGAINGKAYSGSADESGDPESADTPTPSSVLTELLQGVATLAPDQRYRIVETGREGFAILWAATLAGAIVIQGRQFSAPEEHGSEWQVSEARSLPAGLGFGITTDFQVLGWSEETSAVAISYEIDGSAGAVVQSIAFDAGTTEVAMSTAGEPGGTTQAVGSSSSFGLSLNAVAAPSDAAEIGATAQSAAPAAAGPVSLHAGVVDVAGSGGQVLIGDAYTEQDGVEGFSEGDAVEMRDDDIGGTEADDVILGDLPDLAAAVSGPVAGGDDQLAGDAGDDVIYGGGGDDHIDGGESATDASSGESADASAPSIDTAVFTGNAHDYSITVNGDGSYTVVHAASDTGTDIDRSTDGFEGIDIVDDVEQYQFLDGDIDYLVDVVNGADIATLDTSGHGVVLESDLYRIPDRDSDDRSEPYDGTPTEWGLTRDEAGHVENDILVVTTSDDTPASGDAPEFSNETAVADTAADGDSVADAPTIEAPMVSAMSDGGFAVGYVSGDELHVSTFDALGRNDGAATSIAAVDMDTAPVMEAAGEGLAIAYVTAGPDSSIGVEIIGLDTEEPVAGTIEVDGAISGLAMASNDDGQTVTVAWVESDPVVPASDGEANSNGEAGSNEENDSTGGPDTIGEIVIQRLEMSVDDAPALVEAGLDGEAGENSDDAEAIGIGRAPAITETADNGFAVVWVAQDQDAPAEPANPTEPAEFAGPTETPDETATVEAADTACPTVTPDTAETTGVIEPAAVGETAETPEATDVAEPAEHIEGRVFNSLGVVVETFTLPVSGDRHLREGTGLTLETTGDGDLFVAWQEVDDDAGGLAIMSALLRQLGPSEWSYPIIRELRKFDDEPSEITIAIAGENGDAIIVTWTNDGEGGGEIVGQRFSTDAIAEGADDVAVGLEFVIAANSSDGSSRDGVSVAGLDDGRVVVVSRETETRDQGASDESATPVISVQATMLDTRDPAEVLIGADQGAAQDTHVGTVGDDIVDGRTSADELYGALGNDVLTGGTGNDRLDGGADDDTLIGGTGTDHLDGGDGDDLLMGGFGRDYIQGGAGNDTLSYRGETRSVTVDLAAGIVRSDAAHNAVVSPSQDLDVQGISATTFVDANVEDILGRLETTNRGSEGGVEFHAGHGIENVEGGLGADTLLGDGSDNILTGGKGDDVLDGRDGADVAVFSGSSADYEISSLDDGAILVRHVRNTSAATDDGSDTLRNIETVTFADGKFDLQSDGKLSPASIAAAFGIVSEISVAAIECFDFVDLDNLDNEAGSGGNSGSSGSDWLAAEVASGLCGLGSDTLFFGDLDALCPPILTGTSYEDLDDMDGLDYGSCTFLASADIEAAMSLDGPDSLDAMTTNDCNFARPDNCDPTEFRIG